MLRNSLLRTRDPFDWRPFGSLFDDVETMLGYAPTRASAVPRANAYRTNDAYHLVLEVPGLSADKLSIEARDGGLDIQATVDSVLPEGARLLRRERPANLHLERRYTFADDADLDNTTATLKDGLLTITVPRVQPQTHHIEVKVG